MAAECFGVCVSLTAVFSTTLMKRSEAKPFKVWKNTRENIYILEQTGEIDRQNAWYHGNVRTSKEKQQNKNISLKLKLNSKSTSETGQYREMFIQ